MLSSIFWFSDWGWRAKLTQIRHSDILQIYVDHDETCANWRHLWSQKLPSLRILMPFAQSTAWPSMKTALGIWIWSWVWLVLHSMSIVYSQTQHHYLPPPPPPPPAAAAAASPSSSSPSSSSSSSSRISIDWRDQCWAWDSFAQMLAVRACCKMFEVRPKVQPLLRAKCWVRCQRARPYEGESDQTSRSRREGRLAPVFPSEVPPLSFFHTRVTRDLLWLLWHDFECEDSLLLASMSALTPGVLLLPWRFTTVSRAEATVDICLDVVLTACCRCKCCCKLSRVIRWLSPWFFCGFRFLLSTRIALELTTAFKSFAWLDARQQFLRHRYFFDCACDLCSLPEDVLAGRVLAPDNSHIIPDGVTMKSALHFLRWEREYLLYFFLVSQHFATRYNDKSYSNHFGLPQHCSAFASCFNDINMCNMYIIMRWCSIVRAQSMYLVDRRAVTHNGCFRAKRAVIVAVVRSW